MDLRPEDARVLTERNIMPARGPKFLRGDDGSVHFMFVIDSTNIIGPRPATRKDQENHAGAWAAFCAAEGVSALDRDGSGEDGGSLPAESVPVPVADLAAQITDENRHAEVDFGPPVGREFPNDEPPPEPRRKKRKA